MRNLINPPDQDIPESQGQDRRFASDASHIYHEHTILP